MGDVRPRTYHGCRVLRLIDADTVDVDIDYGFGVHQKHRLRLAHINAPEHNTAAGTKATAFAKDWLSDRADTVTVITTLDASGADVAEKYGRFLAEVVDTSGHSLNAALVASKNAVAYEGGKR